MRCALLGLTAFLALGLLAADEGKAKPKTKLEALQPFNDFVGPWRGNGKQEGVDKNKADWSESISWSWKFKGDDAWVTVAFGKGRFFKNGEIHYLPEKDKYQVIIETKDGKKLEFEGTFPEEKKGRSFVAERQDADKNEAQRITFDLVGDIRSVYKVEHKPEGRKLFVKDFLVGATKEGESLAGTAEDKRPKCVVSGGLGTMAVSFKGTTYYVCCSGCRDAFNENPEKYIKEFEAKKGK